MIDPCSLCLTHEATLIASKLGAVCDDCFRDQTAVCSCGQRFQPVTEESLCVACGSVAQDLADGIPGQGMAMDLRVKHALIAQSERAA